METEEIDFFLFAYRILSSFTEFVEARKKEVANGEKTDEVAALEVKNFGHGLAKAMDIAQPMVGVTNMGMLAHVDKRVLEFQPRALADH